MPANVERACYPLSTPTQSQPEHILISESPVLDLRVRLLTGSSGLSDHNVLERDAADSEEGKSCDYGGEAESSYEEAESNEGASNVSAMAQIEYETQ
ncbi:hypothetical protein GN244_ATG06583 [Phytophthora infestans]|uniref:Uncharacterized protein n=1 Tax=Phytophthora infestans TaxID=4787 RepID=A0A833T7P2_PHYIN|nr:hypothetical protein GN244_ATG06583 [Phytophthora infestans]KAF4141542.1 hypothetical protein GN958_ATG09247 [Phytophthora infestans]